MKMKPKNPWTDAHSRLKRLYDERAPEGMTQKEFGQLYGIGSQSMVAQLLAGTKPLTYDSAAKFAKGLRCTIYDICPEMADVIRDEIVPVLGRALRRAAVLALVFLLAAPVLAPSSAHAGDFSLRALACVLCQMSKGLFGRLFSLLVRFFVAVTTTRLAPRILAL